MLLGVKKLNHNAKSPKFFNQTKNIAIVVVVVSRIEKKNPQDNGDRLALIVFLTPFFGCYQFRAWHKKKWAWLNSGLFGLFFGLATPPTQLLL